MRAFGAMLLGLAVLMVWVACPWAEEKKEAVPIIDIENPEYDFSQVPQGQVVRHDFRVFNRGTAALEINKVKTG